MGVGDALQEAAKPVSARAIYRLPRTRLGEISFSLALFAVLPWKRFLRGGSDREEKGGGPWGPPPPPPELVYLQQPP